VLFSLYNIKSSTCVIDKYRYEICFNYVDHKVTQDDD
jgi:hypothetical protein